MKRIAFFFVALSLHHFAYCIDNSFDYNSNCKKAYVQLMALQRTEAKQTLEAEKKLKSNNLIPIYLEDYGDCLELLFNGDAQQYANLKNNANSRIKAIENGDQTSPWYLFCQSNIQLHWALVHLRFGDNFKAAIKFRKSFLLLQENLKLFPKFEENKVLLGLEQSIAGTIPDNQQWIASLFGIKGNVQSGINKIASYINAHPDGNGLMQEEARIYYCYLKFYLQNEREYSWNYINNALFKEDKNLMRSFIKANIALNHQKAETAFQILKKAEGIAEYNHYPILKYELAEAMMCSLNDACIAIYHSFLNQYKGEHFVKDAWLKIAWMSYLKGNTGNANNALAQIKRSGKSETDADKAAMRFAEKPIWPLNSLLEVRLLSEAGMYQKALLKIQGIEIHTLKTPSSILEYHYRYGKIFEELNLHEKALNYYSRTIQMGRQEKDQFAARAALHKGFIFEKKGNKNEALLQFKDCLSMKNHDGQSSIDQQAKAGINRLAP